MRPEKILITGATGMAGSYIAHRAVDAGYAVRALVRPSADRRLLHGKDIEYAEGDLCRPDSLPPAVEGVDAVVHAAAHVGDWGPADLYRDVNVVALEHLLTAAESAGVRRWIQISSLGVYPAGHHHGTDETAPADVTGLDGYTRTKAEAELLLQRHVREYDLPAVVLRPGFIYGRGERHVLPQLIERIKSRKMKMIGDGNRLLNNTYAGNLADAVLLALQKDEAVGETFNIRDERLVTRNEYVKAVCDHLGEPMPGRVPLWLAETLVRPIEAWARWTGRQQAPILTRARIKFLAYNLDYSIDKAKRILGYQARVDFTQGMREALESLDVPGKPVAAGAIHE